MSENKTPSKAKNRPDHKVKTRVLAVFLNLVLIIFSLSCIFPLIWLFYSSLKEKRVFNADIIGLPKSPSFSNYVDILSNKDYHIFASLFNSFRTTIISVSLIIICGFIVGYILARVKFKGNRLLYVIFLMGLLIPIHSLLVPIYVVFNNTGLNNQWFTLIIPYVAFGLPIAIFLVEGYVKAIPVALEEAAAIDGSSFTRTLFTVILPTCKPILTTVGIIQTFGCWNEFSFALVLIRDQALHTVPLAMTQFTGQFSSDYPKIMAALLTTMAPIIVFYFVFSKQIIKGMVAGAVKG
ncbi:carbohydrate ABC transporter permease [Anaeromicropila herbilytica]|uniref:ABC transporter permease n=1 Tax=Anaeromicropila herbilytica TaxID=2785025 RepID=A0A7R7EI47_9FIRM|nr:carbohydrate ABC transporter permease [Anaeromicropila herbilytica]BCN29114.1 ABC transporter permease [Anaeromicropila herbilytica]